MVDPAKPVSVSFFFWKPEFDPSTAKVVRAARDIIIGLGIYLLLEKPWKTIVAIVVATKVFVDLFIPPPKIMPPTPQKPPGPPPAPHSPSPPPPSGPAPAHSPAPPPPNGPPLAAPPGPVTFTAFKPPPDPARGAAVRREGRGTNLGPQFALAAAEASRPPDK